MNFRETFADKKRIVVKIGSSSLTHKETGALNMSKLEVLVRELTDLHNMGKEVVLVSSGAIAVGREGTWIFRTTGEDRRKTGLCIGRPGQTDDDLPEAFFKSTISCAARF